MYNKYAATATAIKQAEQALETLKEFTGNQYKAKGKTMLEQISDYVAHVLSDSGYICGCKYGRLSLSMVKRFIFYVGDDLAIGWGTPVFAIDNNGKIQYLNELDEDMMLTLVREWDGFKKEFDAVIELALKERTKSINKQLAHIGYVNEQLSKWQV